MDMTMEGNHSYPRKSGTITDEEGKGDEETLLSSIVFDWRWCPRGRPKLRWKDTIRTDLKAWNIREEWAIRTAKYGNVNA